MQSQIADIRMRGQVCAAVGLRRHVANLGQFEHKLSETLQK